MASMVNVNTLRNMSEMSDIISELRDMTDDLTVHGAAPYGRLSQVSADNLTEEEFLALVLGPRRQDDRVRHTLSLVFPHKIDCQKKK